MKRVTNSLYHFFLLDNKKRFEALDGVKGYAAILVFLYHASQHTESFFGIHHNLLYKQIEQIFSWVLAFFPLFGTKGSCIGVDLLFEISGFLICYTLLSKKHTNILVFLKNRLLRLLPAHIATLLVFFTSYTPLVIIINVFFLQELIPQTPTINFVTWTILYELLFYLVLSLLLALSKKIHFLGSWWTLGAITGVIWILQWIIPQNYDSSGFKLFYLARFCGFFFGAALAKLYMEKSFLWNKFQKIFPYILITTLVLLIFWKNIWEPSYYRSWRILYYLVLDSLFFILIASMLTKSNHFIKRVCTTFSIRIVGSISYSFYLVHGVIGIPLGLKVMEYIHFNNIISVLLFYVFSFIFTFLVATLLFHFFEKPYFTRKRA